MGDSEKEGMILYIRSEEHELLANVADNVVGGDLEDVEVDGFAEGSALSDQHDVAFLDGESGGDVGGDVAVSLFVTVVFRHIVQIVAPHHNRALHLG